MDIQEILAVIGDLELARRQNTQRIIDLEAAVAARDQRILELEAAAEGEAPDGG
jgi:hypothetical protein